MLILILAGLLLTARAAQEPQRPTDTAPPPMRMVTREDRTRIDETNDSKERVKVTIALAEVQLANAETRSSQNDYPGASTAIGKYWALFEDAFAFLKTMKAQSTKTRDLYKRIELTLRAHGPRLTAMRRGTPAEYAVWIKEVEELARNGRTEALNSFYGHTVFREPKVSPTPTPTPVKPDNQMEAKKP